MADLVPIRKTDDVVAAARSALPDAIEANASGDVLELKRRVEAQRLFEERRNHQEAANRLRRLQIESEAALGLIDVRTNGIGGRGRARDKRQPYLIGDVEVREHERAGWLSLAVAYDRGTLEEILAELESDGRSIAQHLVTAAMRCRGDSFVPKAAVDASLRAKKEELGVSIREIARRAGLGKEDLWAAVRPTSMSSVGFQRLGWWRARRVAVALDCDPRDWPLAPPPSRPTSRKRQWVTRQRKPTGGRWDECYSRFRLCVDEFARLAPNMDSRWDDLYGHFHAIEMGLGAAMKAPIPKTKPKDACINGHQLTPGNTIIARNGRRICKSCAGERDRQDVTERRAICEDLRDWAGRHDGFAPREEDSARRKDVTLPSQKRVKRLFGSWGAAVREAGLELRPEAPRPGRPKRAAAG